MTYDPHSPFASEAYLAIYTYPEYLNNPSARSHLGQMKARFPNSPLTINAHYLLGLSLKAHLVIRQAKVSHLSLAPGHRGVSGGRVAL